MKIFVTSMSRIHYTNQYCPTLDELHFNSIPWYKRYTVGYGIFAVSIIQVIFYLTSTPSTARLLRFEPNQQFEIWRFISYMFLHTSWGHLALNIIVQCFFAIALEKIQGSLRVLVVYFVGGITGALNAACMSPDVVVGASAGSYSLLLSHMSHILLNYENTKHKILRCTAVGLIVITDVFYGIGHLQFRHEPIISWGAHLGGAITGLFLGLTIFKPQELMPNKNMYVRTLFWLGIVMYAILLIILVIINYKIKKCTPPHLVHEKNMYSC
ncbi:protein rhomboid-like [Agrilus planipennis]|uniref:Protein rhomboid-like n=1 Tax=Agrilus planipennis TaxID=224129 RepID=A0A1W4X7Y2_AGRPL|nr:protein rhomboid-like [Agrilus planipennis]XP_018332144.1 protein rhomboid-like [Agrilus planipennis]XP_018332145.1 protein rhomboid-like [Agrilus planipennis]XP_018332146.1 protein rhomboid-like [Agrilus planipennis]